MIVLPIKKKWLDMIKAGIKKEEYREVKPYYTSRFEKVFGTKMDKCPVIMLRNGYSYNSPSVMIRCCLEVGYGKAEWGAKENQKYYIIKILSIMSTK